MEALIKMSEKGQLVVPEDVREEEGFAPGDRFIAIPMKDGVLFKRIHLNLKSEFEDLTKNIENKFKKLGVTKKDIEGAIKWARSG